MWVEVTRSSYKVREAQLASLVREAASKGSHVITALPVAAPDPPSALLIIYACLIALLITRSTIF